MRGVLVGVLALALLAALPAPARAASGHNELTLDVGAASIGMTHAWRDHGARVAFGGGGGVGLYPLPPLGATYATGTHFDYPGSLEFAEILHGQLFLRIQPTSWLRVDGGARLGIFMHLAGDSARGGPIGGLFVAPALAWRWFWIGPRVSGNLIWEHQGETAALLMIEYVMLRFVMNW